MQNAYFNHPRNSAGLSAAINGTGWTIDKSVIDEHGFDMTTITEDQEYTIWCAMNDINIAYCHDAIVYDEFTSNMLVSMKQRVRWSFGMLQNLRKYVGPLLKQAFRGSWQCFDMAMVTLLPVVVLVGLLTAALAYSFVDIPVSIPVFIVGLIVTSWIGASIGALISVVKSGCSVKANIKGIIFFPIFIVTWAPILLSCFFRRRLDWAPMKHDQVVSIEDKNFAGMGATDSAENRNVAKFKTVREGVRAQVQHLKAYASTQPLKNAVVDPRFNLVTRGSAQYVEYLSIPNNPNKKGWASDKDYAVKIKSIIAAIKTY